MTVAILSFRFRLYHVVVPLNFLRKSALLHFYVNDNPVLRPLGGKTLPKKFEMRLNEHILANGVDIKKQEEMNCFSLITE